MAFMDPDFLRVSGSFSAQMFLPVDTITPRNFLSFGPESDPVAFAPLNVIIGTNGAGKSNLIEAIAFMASTPDDLGDFLRSNGGFSQFIWKGATENVTASVELAGWMGEKQPFGHSLAFALSGQAYEVVDESVRLPTATGRLSKVDGFSYERGNAVLKPPNRRKTVFHRNLINPLQSVVSDLQEYDLDSPFKTLKRMYRLIGSTSFYRARHFNQLDVVRSAQTVDQPNRYLARNGSNLASILNRLYGVRSSRAMIDTAMSNFYEGYDGLVFQVQGGTIQFYLQEKWFKTVVSPTRLSDGTIRWLALLSILVDPDPPPLICVEEPETGLHPDMVVELSTLLKKASSRSQVIVTTHSEILVDSFSKTPEVILVCEKVRGQTRFARLDRTELGVWLNEYASLATIWRRNLIGGGRW